MSRIRASSGTPKPSNNGFRSVRRILGSGPVFRPTATLYTFEIDCSADLLHRVSGLMNTGVNRVYVLKPCSFAWYSTVPRSTGSIMNTALPSGFNRRWTCSKISMRWDAKPNGDSWCATANRSYSGYAKIRSTWRRRCGNTSYRLWCRIFTLLPTNSCLGCVTR